MKKLNLKDKIKNFFAIPELNEEECPKKFEKVTLFTLTKNKLFLGILVFLLIINTLVGFDINYFYIRAILSFIFLIIIPGLLIMLMMKIREVGFWEYLVYTVGLSVSFIMFGGLAVNWILPWLNITDKPLSLYLILICFNIFLIAFWIVAYIRNKDFKPLKIQYPKLDLTNRIFFIIPLLFPILSILGAFLLNNHGTNILTMIMLGGIAVYVLLLTIFRKRLNENVFPWALWMIGLSLLLMGSMRGWFLSTVDANLEFAFSNLSLNNGYWNFLSIQDGYNAMLSITILPVILSIFSDVSLYITTKLFFVIIFSIISIILYILFKNYFSSKIAFFSVLLFIFQPTFTGWNFLPPRQEIAFLMLSLFCLSFLKSMKKENFYKLLPILFGLSIVVSHYSTMFIFLIILSFYLLLNFFLLLKKRFRKNYLIQGKRIFIVVLILIVFSFFWYSQVTNVSDSFILQGKNNLIQFYDLFSQEQIIGNDQLGTFNPFFRPQISLSEEINNYTKNFVVENQTNIDNPFSISSLSGSTANYSLSRIFDKFQFILLFIFGLSFIFGLYSFFKFKKFIGNQFLLLCLAFLIVAGLFIITPLSSSGYNLNRLVQQSLILLAPISIYGFFSMAFLFKKYKEIFVCMFLILFLFSFTNSLYFFSDSEKVQLRFANYGKNYLMEFVPKYDVSSANWLMNLKGNKQINLDFYTHFRFYSSKFFLFNAGLHKEIFYSYNPENKNYVYSSSTNKIGGIIPKSISGIFVPFNFPTEFLNDNKNKIYNNGGSEIFK